MEDKGPGEGVVNKAIVRSRTVLGVTGEETGTSYPDASLKGLDVSTYSDVDRRLAGGIK